MIIFTVIDLAVIDFASFFFFLFLLKLFFRFFFSQGFFLYDHLLLQKFIRDFFHDASFFHFFIFAFLAFFRSAFSIFLVTSAIFRNEQLVTSCKRLIAVVVTTHLKLDIRLVMIRISLIFEKLADWNSRMYYLPMSLHLCFPQKPTIYTNRTLSKMKQIALMIQLPTVFHFKVSHKMGWMSRRCHWVESQTIDLFLVTVSLTFFGQMLSTPFAFITRSEKLVL